MTALAELLAKHPALSDGPPMGIVALLIGGILAMLVLSVLPDTAYQVRPRRHRRRRGYDAKGLTDAVTARMTAPGWPAAPPAPGRRPGQVTPEYKDYINGRTPGRDASRKTWKERTGEWKREFRARRGICEIGKVLRRGGYPNCGPSVVTGPIHADHTDAGYAHLFRETRADVALGCEACHAERERLKRQGVYLYQELGEP